MATMRAIATVATFSLLAIGCTLLDNEERGLEGFWGGEVFEVTATHMSFVINQGCYLVTFAGPTRRIQSDSFAISGSVTASSYAADLGRPWRAWGTVSRDTMRLVTSMRDWVDTTQWLRPAGPMILVAGQHSDLVANPTCPI
jgi:hypothetical protein